jgi:hypothetical protein
MNHQEIRAYVADYYSGNSWKRRIENMNLNQVLAIYFRITEGRGVPEQEITKGPEQLRLFK